MKRWLAVSLLLVFSFGLAAEMREGVCADEAAEASCCACLCHVPAAESASVQVAAVQPTHHVASVAVREAKQLFDKSFFHPPEMLA